MNPKEDLVSVNPMAAKLIPMLPNPAPIVTFPPNQFLISPSDPKF